MSWVLNFTVHMLLKALDQEKDKASDITRGSDFAQLTKNRT